MKDFVYEFQAVVQTTQLPVTEQKDLIQLFGRLDTDAQASFVELCKENPEMIMQMGSIIKKKKALFSAPNQAEWADVLSEEEGIVEQYV